MKKFIAVSLMAVLLLNTVLSVKAYAEEVYDFTDTTSLKLIEKIEGDMYIDDGYIYVDHIASKSKMYEEDDMKKVQEFLRFINKKVDDGEIYFDNKQDGVSVENYSMAVNEIRTNIFCVSKAELNSLRNKLIGNAPTTWPAWVASTSLSVLGLIVPSTAGVMLVLATTFSLAGFASNSAVIEAFAQELIRMDSYQYNVIKLRQEYHFPTLTTYLSNNPSKITTTNLLSGRITNTRIPSNKLYLYQ